MPDRTPYDNTHFQDPEPPSPREEEPNPPGERRMRDRRRKARTYYRGNKRALELQRAQTRLAKETAEARYLAAEAHFKEEQAKNLRAATRLLDANAEKVENEADVVGAEASEAQTVAGKTPARHRLAMATGYVGMVFLPASFIALVIVGYMESSVAYYGGGIFAGAGLYAWKPWRLVFSRSKAKEDSAAPETVISEGWDGQPGIRRAK